MTVPVADAGADAGAGYQLAFAPCELQGSAYFSGGAGGTEKITEDFSVADGGALSGTVEIEWRVEGSQTSDCEYGVTATLE